MIFLGAMTTHTRILVAIGTRFVKLSFGQDFAPFNSPTFTFDSIYKENIIVYLFIYDLNQGFISHKV